MRVERKEKRDRDTTMNIQALADRHYRSCTQLLEIKPFD